MVKRGTDTWKKCELTFTWHKPEEDEVDGDKELKSILVQELPENIDDEYIEMFFESPKQNGGPVTKVEHNADDRTAVVTFENTSGT